MPNMNDFESTFNFVNTFSNIMFIVVPLLMILILGFGIAMMVSPKLRGKLMSRQIKSIKHMTDYAKEDLEDIGTTLGDVSINTAKNILDKNEDTLKDVVTRGANISKDGIEIVTGALKKGLTGEKVFCKHCGKQIDSDSKFCKSCGKEQ